MSLSEERIMILKMLEEKKITSEEAARLLEALEGIQNRARETMRDQGSRNRRIFRTK